MGQDMLGGTVGCGSMPVTQGLDSLAEVAEQVPSIGDLDGIRGTLPDAIGVGAGMIAGDDLDARPVPQPGGNGGGLAVGQQIDHPVGLDVDRHRAVAAPAPPGPVIDSEDTRRRRDVGGQIV